VNKVKLAERWQPPGKNCGMCGSGNCQDFIDAVSRQAKEYADCPFFSKAQQQREDYIKEAVYSRKDVLGHTYDFVLGPLPGEISARKIVLPFRADLVDKMNIIKGDFVLGRPMGAGCPVPHVLQVVEADPITGILETWVVGPKVSRAHEVKDVKAYHMIGFQGMAERINRMPAFGCRVTFLPGFCMMNLNHTGLVNMLLEKKEGVHIRIEDIRILAGLDD
jgi:uncharacterized Fe-S cluster-containing protein